MPNPTIFKLKFDQQSWKTTIGGIQTGRPKKAPVAELRGNIFVWWKQIQWYFDHNGMRKLEFWRPLSLFSWNLSFCQPFHSTTFLFSIVFFFNSNSRHHSPPHCHPVQPPERWGDQEQQKIYYWNLESRNDSRRRGCMYEVAKNYLVVQLEGSQVLSSFRKLTLFHPLPNVP